MDTTFLNKQMLPTLHDKALQLLECLCSYCTVEKFDEAKTAAPAIRFSSDGALGDITCEEGK